MDLRELREKFSDWLDYELRHPEWIGGSDNLNDILTAAYLLGVTPNPELEETVEEYKP